MDRCTHTVVWATGLHGVLTKLKFDWAANIIVPFQREALNHVERSLILPLGLALYVGYSYIPSCPWPSRKFLEKPLHGVTLIDALGQNDSQAKLG